MKQLPDGMQEHLDGRATTLCWCWKVERRDGLVQGFTDHDRALAFDGVTYEAMAGFTASELQESVGLSVDNLEVQGAVTSDRLSEADLQAGLYDDAQVEIYRVNWSNTEQRVLMRSGSLGEVRRSDRSFVAEVRGLSHYLQQPQGRLFQYACDADLGDTKCGIALTDPLYRGSGSVTAVVNARRFNVTGFSDFATQWFERGQLQFESGLNAGNAFQVRRHDVIVDLVVVELWSAPARDVMVDDTVTITAGCDKVLATCRDKFSNVANYRGFPHIPGNDFVTAYARQG
ncbi:MAG: DUF2163 domain-containing protein [Pseudomonadota bacterium]